MEMKEEHYIEVRKARAKDKVKKIKDCFFID